MILVGRNYGHYYEHGRGEYIPAEPGKEIPIMRQGAESGRGRTSLELAYHRGYLLERQGGGAQSALCLRVIQKDCQQD